MFFSMVGIGLPLGEILGFENVNFGPLYVLSSLGGPTPDLTREHYSPGGPEKNGYKIVYFGPLFILTHWGLFEKNVFSMGGIGPHLGRYWGVKM